MNPPLLPGTRRADTEQLRLVVVFHFVVAGLTLPALGFIYLHYLFMRTIFTHPEWSKKQPAGPPPEAMLEFFHWFYLGSGVLLVLAGIANLVSGIFIRRRVNRTFSLVVAGFDCLQFPFGTALGVFTFVVLLRDSVRACYTAGKPAV